MQQATVISSDAATAAFYVDLVEDRGPLLGERRALARCLAEEHRVEDGDG